MQYNISLSVYKNQVSYILLYMLNNVYLAETEGSIYNPHVNDMFVICNIFL